MPLVLSSLALMADPVGVQGTVVDATGNPVAGAMVMLTGWGPTGESKVHPVLVSATTDEKGHFRLPGPPADAFKQMPFGTIWAYRPGLAFGAVHYSPVAAVPDLKIPLPAAGRVVVALRRKDGSPVPGVLISPQQTSVPNSRGSKSSYFPENLAALVSVRTGDNGEVVFESFPERLPPLILQVVSEATGAQMLPPPDRPGVVKRLEFVVEPAGSIRGRVVLGDGKPAGGILVGLERETPRSGGAEPVRPMGGPVLTHPDGSFESPPILLEGGRYRVVIQKEGYAPTSSEWVSPARVGAAAETRPIALRALVAVAGRVVDRQGKPVAGAEVSQSGDGPAKTTATTDADGRFRLGGYNGPRGFVFAEAEGFRFGGAIVKEGRAEVKLTRLTETPERSLKRRTPPLPPKELREIARASLTPYLAEMLTRPDLVLARRAIGVYGLIDPDAAIKTLEGLKGVDEGRTTQMLAAIVAPEDTERAIALTGAIPDVQQRVSTFIAIADAFQPSRKADRVAVLKRALQLIREQPSREDVLAQLGEVAERLAEDGEAEESRKAFDEGLALRKWIVSTPEGLHFTACLAGSRPEAALGLLAEMDPKSLTPDAIATVMIRLATSRPVEAANLFSSVEGFRRSPPMTVLERMARVDPARAVQVLEAQVEPISRGGGRLLIAHGMARSNPAEAERTFRQALREMVDVTPTPALRLNSLSLSTPIVEGISPTLVPEYLWHVLSRRPPTAADDAQAALRNTQLVTIVAQYDREIAGEIWAPIEEMLRSGDSSAGTLRNVDIVTALAWLDPKKALEWVEARPVRVGPKGVPANDPARLILAEILGQASRGFVQPLLPGVVGLSEALRRRYPL